MPLPRVYRVVQDSLGNVVPQVLCSVLLQGTGTLATLWQNDAGTIPLSNPMTSDATYGSFGFYVEPGHYDLTFTKPGYTFQPHLDLQVPQDDLTLGTMAQQDASAVAITGGGGTFTAPVGLGVTPNPAYSLTVQGSSFLNGPVGLGVAPNPAYSLVTQGASYLNNPVGCGIAPNVAFSLATGGDVFIGGGGLIEGQTQVNDNLIVAGGGKLGIGIAPTTYPLDVVGATRISSDLLVQTQAYKPGGGPFLDSSSRALKTAIAPLTDALATLLRLQGRTFEWTEPQRAQLFPGPQVGLIAEEVADVVPQWVGQDPAGALTLGARGLEAYVVEALRTIVSRLEAVEARLASLGPGPGATDATSG